MAQKTPSHTSAINKVSYHFNIPISNQIFFSSIEVEFCLEDVWLWRFSGILLGGCL